MNPFLFFFLLGCGYLPLSQDTCIFLALINAKMVEYNIGLPSSALDFARSKVLRTVTIVAGEETAVSVAPVPS